MTGWAWRRRRSRRVARYLARERRRRSGIRVNLVSAGPIETLAAGGIPGFYQLADVWSRDGAAGVGLEDPGPVADADVLPALAAGARDHRRDRARGRRLPRDGLRVADGERRPGRARPGGGSLTAVSAILLTGASGFLGMDALGEPDRARRGRLVVLRARARRGRRAGALGGRAGASVRRAPGGGGAGARVARRSARAGSWPVGGRPRHGWWRRSIGSCTAPRRSRSSCRWRRRGRSTSGGVERVLELAREIAERGSLRRVVHVSTAYVSGRHAGEFGERDLEVGQEFRNTYERSKQEAERLLADALDLPLAVARPSIVVGHSASGWTSAFNVLYWPMRAFERGLLREVPARADSIVDFVPVDYVTDGILALLDDERAHGTYNLVAGGQALDARRAGGAARLADRARAGALRGEHGRRRTAGCPRARRRSRPTSTCAAASATTRARRAARRRRCAQARPARVPGAADRLRAARAGWGKRASTREGSFALSSS